MKSHLSRRLIYAENLEKRDLLTGACCDIPYLSEPTSIRGFVRTSNQEPLAGRTVYLDANRNGLLDTHEVRRQTDLTGEFHFDRLAHRNYRIAVELFDGDAIISPASFDLQARPNTRAADFIFAAGSNGTTDQPSPQIQPSAIAGRRDSIHGRLESTDGPLIGWTVFLDRNANGRMDTREIRRTTNLRGEFTFDDLLVDVDDVVASAPASFSQADPASRLPTAQIIFDTPPDQQDLPNADELAIHSLADSTVEASVIPAPIVQITDSTGGRFAGRFSALLGSANDNGTEIAFYSDRDLAGNNADANLEIFVYDQGSDEISQVTDSTGGDNAGPVLTQDGRIWFISTADLTNQNADGNQELFVVDRNSDTIQQLTQDDRGRGIDFLVGSADGRYLAFSADREIVAGSNPNRNNQVFLFDSLNSRFTQVTNLLEADVSHSELAISADGNFLTFASDDDLLPGTNADGSSEVFLYDIAQETLSQVTDFEVGLTAFADQPSISADGNRIGFRSSLDIVGENPDGNIEAFLYDVAEDQFEQLTDSVGGAASSVGRVIVNGDGDQVVFSSNHDIAGNNPGQTNQLFSYDVETNEFNQLTTVDEGINANDYFLSRNGSRLIFTSQNDLVGSNADANFEVFLLGSAINVEASILGQAADFPSGPRVPIGANVVWTYRVSNLSDLAFTDVQLVESSFPTGVLIERQTDSVGNDDDSFDPNEVWVFEANSPAVLGLQQSTVTVTASDLNGNQVEAQDLSNYTGFAFGPSLSLRQVTDSAGAQGALASSLSASGSRIVFSSDGQHGLNTNPDGNLEIFTYDSTTDTFNQITETADGGNGSPSLDAAGQRIVFVSDRDLVPGMNSDGSLEVFLFDSLSDTFTQITNTDSSAGGNGGPKISGDGTHVAFFF